MLIKKDLPKCSFKTSEITYRKLSHPEYDLFFNGSIAKTVKVDEINIPKMTEMINKSEYGTSIQIYLIGKRDIYVTVQIEIAYDLKVKWKELFGNERKMLKCVDMKTEQALEKIDQMCTFKHSGHLKDPKDLIASITTCKPASNISLIKTGESRVSTIMSVNNIAQLKSNNFIETDKDFITVISLIKPKKEINQVLSEETFANVKLISKINENSDSTKIKRVHTIDVTEEDTILKYVNDNWYINVSFLIHAKHVEKLKEKCKYYQKRFISNGIILYQHTNSTFNQYMSLFCGYACYGEHFHTGLSEFVKRVLFTYLTY